MFAICPKCLSVESEEFCSQCGYRFSLNNENDSIFNFRIGWSKSKMFEEILKQMHSEEGYKYIERGEDIFHEIPVKDLENASRILRKYQTALKWKDTVLRLDTGREFDLRSPTGSCFLNLQIDGDSPCKRHEECPYSPFPVFETLENPSEFLNDIVDCSDECNSKVKARIFVSILLQNQDVVICPLYRALVSLVAVESFADDVPWSFISSSVRRALKNGTLIFNDDGNYMSPPESGKANVYEVKELENPDNFKKWGAVGGDLALAYDGNTLVTVPDHTVVATWSQASSVMKTDKDRYIIMPPWNQPDVSEFVMLSEQNVSSVVLWDRSWVVDSHLTRCAFQMSEKDAKIFSNKKKTEGGIFLGHFVWRDKHHFIIKEDFVDLNEDILQMKITQNGFAVATENKILLKNNKETAEFTGIYDITGFEILRNGTLVVLWQNGWKISFLEVSGDRKDYLLLLKADELHSTVSGDAILAFPHRILEISETGEILDYRQNEKAVYNVTAQGYLEKTEKSALWHYLDNTVLKDVFPESVENNTFILIDMPKARAKFNSFSYDLMIELLDYLIYFSNNQNITEKVRELWKNLPAGASKDFARLTSSFGWLKRVVEGKSDWPVKTKKFTLDVT